LQQRRVLLLGLVVAALALSGTAWAACAADPGVAATPLPVCHSFEAALSEHILEHLAVKNPWPEDAQALEEAWRDSLLHARLEEQEQVHVAALRAEGPCLMLKATAYDAGYESNGRWTGHPSALGLPLRHGIVAVDPEVIPLGTRLYVEGYGYALAADTGSAIKGDRIDLFMADRDEALAFGVRQVRVYLLD